MNKIIRTLVALLVLCGFSALSMNAFASDEDFPEAIVKAKLKMPEDPAAGPALGVKQKPGETISLTDIDAEIIIVEIFSMYCPHCQKHAPEERLNQSSSTDRHGGSKAPGYRRGHSFLRSSSTSK
jgi:protein-disulfide isomerase